MQGKSSILRWSALALIILAFMIVPSVKNSAHASGAAESNIAVAYPASTHLCIGGCREHQNWIGFYLASDRYVEGSLKLKTNLFWAQILTYGISSMLCTQQDRPGYTCLDMEISYRLLSGLIDLNLSPLSQIRDTRNWWLEYQLKN